MAKAKKSIKTTKTKRARNENAWYRRKSTHTAVGLLLLFFSMFGFIAFTSFFFHWSYDQSTLREGLLASDVRNILGKAGAMVSHLLVWRYFGVSAYFIPYFLLILGIKVLFQPERLKPRKLLWGGLLAMIWFVALTGLLFSESHPVWAGGAGYTVFLWMKKGIGTVGTALVLFFTVLLGIVRFFNITPAHLQNWLSRPEKASAPASEMADANAELEAIPEEIETEEELPSQEVDLSMDDTHRADEAEEEEQQQQEEEKKPYPEPEVVDEAGDDVELSVEETVEEELSEDDAKAKRKVEDFGAYDPRLDLSTYQFPTIDLLNDYGKSNITVDQDELEANKNRIVETLKNYKIEIAKIKATIGPTITLYEIVPEAGIRISKIKNLEDDIALSLSALGIRIIAPIPGRGTIGIEVPNTKKNIVSIRSVIASEKFQKSEMELPIVLGKTISNETFVTDLAKMPHMLMAGATGQGKSVGLNAVLTSLLYKKHPTEVKFVLVDPKKVELTLFNKIERHYLAKLPNEEEAIITDTKKVINTLNSLCIEMDDRYEILKTAMCRNIVEYNKKFVSRKLNPEEGHRYLPYIVLVIDEFADLIMTAGKEVETPIARLAQLARAIGIHLIIATQRPSVNVITGIIKANFPCRIAFRVTSKIDSRTILDAGGADQLIGKGDMLIAQGSELTRLQCAFVDTPEVEKITDFIGNQRAYPEAHLLPEYVGEEGGEPGEVDLDDRDSLFEDAARILVQHQQGSASLLQRKLKLGYNRAGRIIDQLETAGIIGPFEGSKARKVLIPDEMALDEHLRQEKE
ncbi:MAG: DNA translocase FtsK 4TM domain-containing protein [Flavobacteriales bacterium]|nr:DNA translocase FtsK 4TM domain-containing protein [Flavobacteriales bacterium]